MHAKTCDEAAESDFNFWHGNLRLIQLVNHVCSKDERAETDLEDEDRDGLSHHVEHVFADAEP